MTETEGIESWKHIKIGESALNVGLPAYPAFASRVSRHLVSRHCIAVAKSSSLNPCVSSGACRGSVSVTVETRP